MKTNRLSISFTRVILPVFLALLPLLGCQQDRTTKSVPNGSWNAAFRVSAGELTPTQMATATWVRVEASRSGSTVTSAEAAYSAGRMTLTIPNAGAVDIKLTGYDNQSKSTVMWTGSGTIANGVADTGANIVTLAAGPGLTPVSSPMFSPAASTYTSAQSVTLSTTTSGASIYYTVDGSIPTTSSTLYSGAISVDLTETVKAIVVKSGMTNSAVASAAYTIIPWQWQTGITYGSVTDSAGQTYKTVKIGSQWWMAENLNYSGVSGSTGVCYNNSADFCKEYGRLYTWSEVMVGHVSSTTSPRGVQGLCPTGWHVPSDAEWTTMQTVVDPTNTADGTKLRSTAVRNHFGNGTDTYGFRVLPAGVRDDKQDWFITGGYSANFWSASESAASSAWLRYFYYGYANVSRYGNDKANGLSLRCLEDYTISIPATVAPPTFSLAAGTYKSARSVTLSSTSGASIYYTVDGSIPTLYNGAISVSTNVTIKAIAATSGMTNSSVSSAAYTINSSITYGCVTDPAGQTYKTVKIGTQWWMAENLNYSGTLRTTGACFKTSAGSCKEYGRLYTWAEVMNDATSSTTIPSGVKGICPAGWHVPSDAEWTTMQNVVDASNITDGTELKSSSGWIGRGNGTDTYGFCALPGAGVGDIYRNSIDVGFTGYWWSATENDAANAWSRSMNYENADVLRFNSSKTSVFSLRCLDDYEGTVSAPTFSPAAGMYTSTRSVTLSTTSGASIYYTVDGSTPTSSSTLYSGAISVSTNATIKAIAVKSGMTTSSVSSAAYTILIPATVAPPTFSPAAGMYTSAQSVTLSTKTFRASIYYTVDGSTPTSSSTLYSGGAISVVSTETVNAIAVKSGMTTSSVSSAAYTILIPVTAPTFSLAAGTYTSAQSVTLSTTTSGATIYYTVDGSTPTSSSTAYRGAISVSTSATINAIAVKSGMTNSTVSSAAYTIIPWQTGITYGSVTDPAGQTYKTVKIGSQWWMAENLNYSGTLGTTGVCYSNSADSCKKYGRFYTWAEVMNGATSSTTIPSGVKGICPTGWHVPSDAEWTTMQNVVDASNTTGGTKLKSTSGWSCTGNGTDTYGFRALPGGDVNGGAGSVGIWWSAAEGDGTRAWFRGMVCNDASVNRINDSKTIGFSLRCLED